MKLDPYLTSHTEINSERIKDLNVRPKTIQLREEKVEELQDLAVISWIQYQKHSQQNTDKQETTHRPFGPSLSGEDCWEKQYREVP